MRSRHQQRQERRKARRTRVQEESKTPFWTRRKILYEQEVTKDIDPSFIQRLQKDLHPDVLLK